MVAEPSAGMSELLVACLRGIGVRQISRVFDSQAAERVLTIHRLDAALVGFDLKPKGIAELVVGLRRSRKANAHIPVIGIGARVSEPELSRARLAGVNSVLRPPISGEALRLRLLDVIAERVERAGAIHEI